jgi:hypothetical protein
MTEATVVPTIEQLRAKIAEAANKGDDVGLLGLMKELNSRKAAIAKAANERLIAEATRLAGVREALEVELFATINKLTLMRDGKPVEVGKLIHNVKARGFTFPIEWVDNSTVPPTTNKAVKVSLIVPTVKAVKSGGHGGAAGKSSKEFGMSLTAIFDKFASEDDKLALAQANSGGAKWAVKVRVKKAAIAAGLLTPAK